VCVCVCVCVCVWVGGFESSELRIFYSVLSCVVPDPVSDFGLLGTTKASCLIRADTSLSSPPPCDLPLGFNLPCSNQWVSLILLLQNQ
jgi:hypothetical protein